MSCDRSQQTRALAPGPAIAWQTCLCYTCLRPAGVITARESGRMDVSRRGVLLVVSGPSGVGKGTLIRGVTARHPAVGVSISCTTRPPRPGDRDGVDYVFMSPADFQRRREAGEFLEWAEVYPGAWYATPGFPVEEALRLGQDMIVEIDDQGAQSVRELLGAQAVLVFVAPPAFSALGERLRARCTESPDQLSDRFATSRQEIAHLHLYDYVIVNDEVSEATTRLEAILLAEQARTTRLDCRDLQARLLASDATEGVGASG